MTLFFQIQFIKADRTVNARTVIKCSLRKEILLARRHKDLKANIMKENIMMSQKKRQVIKKRYENKKNPLNS